MFSSLVFPSSLKPCPLRQTPAAILATEISPHHSDDFPAQWAATGDIPTKLKAGVVVCVVQPAMDSSPPVVIHGVVDGLEKIGGRTSTLWITPASSDPPLLLHVPNTSLEARGPLAAILLAIHAHLTTRPLRAEARAQLARVLARNAEK